ncbi:Omega-amino acid-pyruvate aminotransferase [Hartmannibacter diazotrophicus]|uniref:Omega-amino acid-pyruvate aminotransferase n=1 Tax=Hartmannibacter diazotrophicus TaxID=1482074 RepID=A0A2C9D3Z7_9HYPH|nr:aspartate aminotransferase family protein [Hartmannibacter diazotrophicus]SON55004.1 Omega-amino acid-pyruvate aminotransferase [Hartmannibacter diazotrophicus]
MADTRVSTNNLDSFWMPFTANRQFKQDPRMLVSAKGMYYKNAEGRQILDGTAGLWCVNAGHARPKIVEAIATQAGELDYAPAFQMGHPKAFELASRLTAMLPSPMDHVFFTNSGSESVETALKIALAYHRAKGNGSKFRLLGRERGYHGVNFGGISVGGIVSNRKMFGTLLTGVDHIRHTHDLERNAFTRGVPEHGEEFADDLEQVITLHDPSTIAALIVEPVAGSTGVLIPPKGYLEKLRAICDKHDILLIFDEVITGFGRLGTPFAVDYFGVMPDLITTAKGITSGTVPMGAVFLQKKIYDAFMNGPEHVIEFFHGYTYSGHPLACAAALATLDTYAEEGLLTKGAMDADEPGDGKGLGTYWQTALHSLRGMPHVIDIRNIGLVGAIELESIPGAPTKRAFNAFLKAYEKGVMIRTTGDIIALSPPLIVEDHHIDEIVATLAMVLKDLE